MSQHANPAGSGISAMSVSRPYLAIVMNLLIIVAGVAAVFGVEVRELPDVDRPIVTVRGNYPGGSPETIDAEITAKVEAAVARVNGIIEVRSSSEEGNFRIRATFKPSIDLIDAANDMREAVSRVQRELPEGLEDLFVIKADSDSQPTHSDISAPSRQRLMTYLSKLLKADIAISGS